MSKWDAGTVFLSHAATQDLSKPIKFNWLSGSYLEAMFSKIYI